MSDVTVTIRNNGPYVVQGPIDLRDAEGNPVSIADTKVVALCRCGGSVNKPFCDGTHSKIGFQGAQAAVEGSSCCLEQPQAKPVEAAKSSGCCGGSHH